MKVLHVISQRPDSTGSGIYLQAVMKLAARAGHENYLVAGIEAGSTVDLEQVEPSRQIFVLFGTSENPGHIVGMSDVMPYPSRTFRELSQEHIEQYLQIFQIRLKQAIERFRPDIIHTHHLWLITAMVRRMVKHLPVVTSCHGSELRQLTQCPHLHEHVVADCRQLDGVLALTEEQRLEISRRYDLPLNRICVAGAGYHDDIFHPGTNAKTAAEPVLLYAGKLSKAKGVPWLLEALIQLMDAPFHLHLAGGGSGHEYQECLALAQRLSSRVTIHGAVLQARLAQLMRQTDIFVLPSLHEGLPLVILEALACGCRVVATGLPGTQEIANRLNSAQLLLIRPPRVLDTDRSEIADETSFVSNIRSALYHLMQTRSRQQTMIPTALRHYTWANVFQTIETIWRRVASPDTSR